MKKLILMQYRKIQWSGLIVITGILLAGCGYSDRMEEKKHEKTDSPGFTDEKISDQNAINQTYRLWYEMDQFDLKAFQYYGSFYDNRLKFFYTTNSEIQLGDADVDLLMLYFLDQRLVKIRYHLNRDITQHLMDSLGLGNLKTRFNQRKQVYATESNIKKLKEYNQSKKEEDDYEILWDRHVIYSSYKVDPKPSGLYSFDTIQANFVYVDQLKSYRKRLIDIENAIRRGLSMNQ